MEPLFIKPVLKHTIWGGDKLRTVFGYQEEGNDIGECWGISAHPNGDCEIVNGEFAGKKLSEIWSSNPEIFGLSKKPESMFPLLIKIIDARDDLSIQVHPSDDYAMKYENGSYGKTECWYILDCAEGATLVAGHNAQTEDELKSMVDEQRWGELIRQIPVKKGDFIQIDPGTVHAIKGGITLLETQQNSDITYRVYDYDRLQNGKPRELHIQKSLDVITVPALSGDDSIVHTQENPVNTLNLLHSCKYYNVYQILVKGDCEISHEYPYMLMSVSEGQGNINGIEIKKGDHIILPNGYGTLKFAGEMEIICSENV